MRRLLPPLIMLSLSVAAPATASARPTAARVVAAAQRLGVGPIAERLQRRFLPGARLVADPSRAGVVGASRLGGSPDLPRGAGWPSCHGHPLSLLTQISLRELASAAPGQTRARTGILAVFGSEAIARDTGFPEVDSHFNGALLPGDCLAVRVFPRGALRHRATPRGARTLPATPVRLRPTVTVPDWEYAEQLLGRRLDHRESDRWIALAGRAAAGDLGRPAGATPLHQVLGWSRPLQADPTIDCTSTHLPPGPRRLLLQLDSDGPLPWDGGGGRILVITMPAADLRAGRFDRLCGQYQFD